MHKELAEQIEQHFQKYPENSEQSQLCLSMGIPIYYVEENIEHECIVKEYPNGKKQLIKLINNEEEIIYDNY